jgi:hypothetical protein
LDSSLIKQKNTSSDSNLIKHKTTRGQVENWRQAALGANMRNQLDGKAQQSSGGAGSSSCNLQSTPLVSWLIIVHITQKKGRSGKPKQVRRLLLKNAKGNMSPW